MAKKKSAMRWGGGFKFSMKVEGGEKLQAELQKMGADALRVVKKATYDGANAVYGDIRRDAPGPHIEIVEADKPRAAGVFSVEMGPDKEHFFYQFFETGVQPFEINMVKRRSKRSSGRGRKLKGDKKAIHFGDIFAKRIQRGGMAARPFLRTNFIPKRAQIETAFGATIKAEVTGE